MGVTLHKASCPVTRPQQRLTVALAKPSSMCAMHSIQLDFKDWQMECVSSPIIGP